MQLNHKNNLINLKQDKNIREQSRWDKEKSNSMMTDSKQLIIITSNENGIKTSNKGQIVQLDKKARHNYMPPVRNEL